MTLSVETSFEINGSFFLGEDWKKQRVRLIFKVERLPFSGDFQVLTFCIRICIRLKALSIYSEVNALVHWSVDKNPCWVVGKVIF